MPSNAHLRWTEVHVPKLLRDRLQDNRHLDKGNANPGNLGSDFSRFGLDLWVELYAVSRQNRLRNQRLDALNKWRNGIARQDFTKTASGERLGLQEVRRLRRACSALVQDMDRGNLGVAGRRLVRVRVGKADDTHEFEIPAEDLLVVA